MQAAKRRVGAWLLGLVALVASPALAIGTLPAPETPLPSLLVRATADALEAELAGDVASAPPTLAESESGFSLGPVPLDTHGPLFDDELRFIGPLPRFDVEPLRLPETRVRAFSLFDPPSRLLSNRVSDGSATGFGLCLVETCDRPIQCWLSEDPAGAVDSPSLYAFVGHAPNMGRDPLGLRAATQQDVGHLRNLSKLESAFRSEYKASGTFRGQRITPEQYEHGLLDVRSMQSSYMQAVADAYEGEEIGRFSQDVSFFDVRDIQVYRAIPSQARWERETSENSQILFWTIEAPDTLAMLLAPVAEACAPTRGPVMAGRRVYRRDLAARREALLRDAADSNSGLSPADREFILKHKGQRVPPEHEVSHEVPLYTVPPAERPELDVEPNMKTQPKGTHRERHKPGGDQYETYGPPSSYPWNRPAKEPEPPPPATVEPPQ